MAFPEESLQELAALGEVALRYDDLASAQDEICRIAVRAVPGTEGASLTSTSDRGSTAVAASSDWSRELDESQFDEHEGPCLDAARTGLVFRIRDTEDEPRWPFYMPRAAKLGARSMVSLPMTNESKVIGALNLYSLDTDNYSVEHVSVGEIIAGHASLASRVAASLFQHRDLAEQLRAAMASRSTIEQAKGVIMATTRCGPDEAFEVLVGQSQSENRKVRDIAEEIVRRQSR